MHRKDVQIPTTAGETKGETTDIKRQLGKDSQDTSTEISNGCQIQQPVNLYFRVKNKKSFLILEANNDRLKHL